jgi:hypothetical protein
MLIHIKATAEHDFQRELDKAVDKAGEDGHKVVEVSNAVALTPVGGAVYSAVLRTERPVEIV